MFHLLPKILIIVVVIECFKFAYSGLYFSRGSSSIAFHWHKLNHNLTFILTGASFCLTLLFLFFKMTWANSLNCLCAQAALK